MRSKEGEVGKADAVKDEEAEAVAMGAAAEDEGEETAKVALGLMTLLEVVLVLSGPGVANAAVAA